MIYRKKTRLFEFFIIFIVSFSFFSCSFLEKKKFESKLDKNKLERCVSRKKNKCNSKRERCMLYDKKTKDECNDQLSSCIKQSNLNCEKQYN